MIYNEIPFKKHPLTSGPSFRKQVPMYLFFGGTDVEAAQLVAYHASTRKVITSIQSGSKQ